MPEMTEASYPAAEDIDTAVVGHDPVGNGKAEAGPSPLGLRRKEGIEDPRTGSPAECRDRVSVIVMITRLVFRPSVSTDSAPWSSMASSAFVKTISKTCFSSPSLP